MERMIVEFVFMVVELGDVMVMGELREYMDREDFEGVCSEMELLENVFEGE